jgi:hypothetical protein
MRARLKTLVITSKFVQKTPFFCPFSQRIKRGFLSISPENCQDYVSFAILASKRRIFRVFA